MNRYFPKILIISAVLGSLLFSTALAAVEIENPLRHDSFEQLLDAILTFLAFYLAPPVAVIMILTAGFYFATAAGNPDKIEKGKKIILWTLVGLIIVFSAKGITALLEEVIGVEPVE